MISINTNYGGIFAAKASGQSQGLVDTAMERLSTGKRINNAGDDAAGQAIATRLTAEIQGLSMASRNAADAQSMVDTAEGAMQEVHTILLRMRELAVQSANGTLTDADRDHTDAEFQHLEAEITRISDNTKWAGKGLIDGIDAFANWLAGTIEFLRGYFAGLAGDSIGEKVASMFKDVGERIVGVIKDALIAGLTSPLFLGLVAGAIVASMAKGFFMAKGAQIAGGAVSSVGGAAAAGGGAAAGGIGAGLKGLASGVAALGALPIPVILKAAAAIAVLGAALIPLTYALSLWYLTITF